MQLRNLTLLFIVLSLSVLTASDQCKAKWVISGGVDHADISGDFNGYNVLSTGTTAWLIPNVKADNGYNFSVGVTPNSEVAIFRVVYAKTKHTSWWFDEDTQLDVEHTKISWLDLQLHLKESFLQPFILFNLSVEKFIIKDGLEENLGSGVQISDGELRGPSIGLGAGVRTKFYNRLSFSARATKVWGDVKKVKGGFYKEYIDADDISFSGWNFRLYVDVQIF